jgi:hypothetical protein
VKSSAQAPSATTAMRPRRPGQTLKLFAAAVFLAFVLPMLLLAGLLAWHQHRILTTWPVVDAVVVTADWTRHDSAPGHGPVYGARFSFRYSAAGRVYEASADLKSAARSDVERWISQMPVGSHQRLRYDPGNPANISLAVDYRPRSLAAPLTLAKWAGIITAVCVILFWLGGRAGKQESVVGGR